MVIFPTFCCTWDKYCLISFSLKQIYFLLISILRMCQFTRKMTCDTNFTLRISCCKISSLEKRVLAKLKFSNVKYCYFWFIITGSIIYKISYNTMSSIYLPVIIFSIPFLTIKKMRCLFCYPALSQVQHFDYLVPPISYTLHALSFYFIFQTSKSAEDQQKQSWSCNDAFTFCTWS